MLQNGKFKVSYRSENQIEAFKAFNHGRIHLRIRREKARYFIRQKYHWIANFHFEIGLRPKRYFDSPKVHEFSERYVTPYAIAK
jgi:hypothetical protein